MSMNRIRKILTQHWVVNLITTTLGVYLGIFATNYYAKKSAVEKTEKAFEKVRTELLENYEAFVKWDSTSRINYDAVEFMVNSREEDGDFIMTVAEMKSNRRKYANFLSIEDSTRIALDTFKYEGSFSIDINSELLLSPGFNTAWTALKKSESFNYLEFDCAESIEVFYYAAQYSFEQRMLWYNKFVELVRMMSIGSEQVVEDKIGDKLFMKELLFEWKRENDFNQSIVESISESKEKLNNCIEY